MGTINYKDIEIKEKFKEHFESLTDFEAFMEASLTPLKRCIRVNTLKISVVELKKRLEKEWILTQVPWCKEGFWIEHKTEEEKRDIGNLKEHQLGYFYVQGASSMIPPIALDPKPGDLVLDMAAAPGSKTTQIAQYMENKGTLIANDVKGIRLAALGINVQKMGITNAVLTLMEGRHFKNMQFDKILLDAPCSGTGTIAKSFKTLEMWNINMVRRLVATQKQLLKTAVENLKQGGTLVYSTCSVEPEENEGVISWALENLNLKIEEIKLPGLKKSNPILESEGNKFNPEVKKCLRIWPQDNNTTGFFVTKLIKK